jgi:hypothetical protein
MFVSVLNRSQPRCVCSGRFDAFIALKMECCSGSLSGRNFISVSLCDCLSHREYRCQRECTMFNHISETPHTLMQPPHQIIASLGVELKIGSYRPPEVRSEEKLRGLSAGHG